MATYKLIQDIEAEDHILGPLTLRQFIYGLVACFLYYMCFLLVTKGVAFLLILFVPPALFCTFFAFPFGRDQSTEVWALAKLRFFLKPRKRIWDQTGMKELVTVTAPKKIEQVLTNGLTQTEVKSRLTALADTLDSRGWAVKNVNVNAFSQPNPFMAQASDRLIDVASIPQEVPSYDVRASDDILDETSNPLAQQFEQMITQSEHVHRQQLMNRLNSSAPAAGTQQSGPSSYWFINKPGHPAGSGGTQTASAHDVEETSVDAVLKAHRPKNDKSLSHLRTLQPSGAGKPSSDPPQQAQNSQQPEPPKAMKPQPDPAILSLATNNDLNVATLARQAEKAKRDKETPDDEVVISLR